MHAFKVVLMAIIVLALSYWVGWVAKAQLSQTGAGIVAGGGTPVTACPANGLDFQDACGTTQYMVLWR